MSPTLLLMVGEIRVGRTFEAMTYPPITRLQLALYCGGSGDHNPVHVDQDYARANGFEDVFAHGTLLMSIASRRLEDLVPRVCIRRFGVRFTRRVEVGDELTVMTRISRVDATSNSIELELSCTNQNGDRALSGTVAIELPRELRNFCSADGSRSST